MPAPSDKNEPPSRRPIVLIGFMATGKSTVGRLVAARLQRPFVDLDRAIEEAAGMTVPEIFETEGEAAFRTRETAVLGQVLANADTVVATGGGAACREPNLTMMLDRGHVVALWATPEEIVRRTGGASGRPLLDGADDPVTAAKALLSQREPFYRRAHARVDTGGKTADEVAAEVLAAVAAEEESP